MLTNGYHVSTQYKGLEYRDSVVLSAMGYFQPTDAQVQIISTLKDHDGDFVGQFVDDSGKVPGYLVSLLKKLDMGQRGIQALIMAPTSESCTKISEDLDRLTGEILVRKALLFGGIDLERQKRILEKGRPHILIGTPEKLVRYFAQGMFQLHHVKTLVIDESVQMEHQNFIEDIDYLVKQLSWPRRLWLFTAELTPSIQKLINRHFQKRVGEKKTVFSKRTSAHEHHYNVVEKKHFLHALGRYLLRYPAFTGVVFCEKKNEAVAAYKDLLLKGRSVGVLHGDMDSHSQERVLNMFSSEKTRILVTTDMALRSLPSDSVEQVIHLGTPANVEDYLKRTRILQHGVSHLILAPRDYLFLKRLDKEAGIVSLSLNVPSNAETKDIAVKSEMKKLDSLRSMLKQKGKNFVLDRSFKHFEHSMKGLDREEILKVVFTWKFNKQLKEIDAVRIESEEEILNRSRMKALAAARKKTLH